MNDVTIVSRIWPFSRRSTRGADSTAMSSTMWLLPRSARRGYFIPWFGRIRRLDLNKSDDDDDATVLAELRHSFSSQLVMLQRIEEGTDVASQTTRKAEWLRRLANYLGGDVGSLKTLVHSNLQTLMGICVHPLRTYVVRDHIVGTPVLEFLRQHQSANRRQIVLEIARALAFLHGRGVVHGFVCANQVLVTSDGCAVLTGLGSGLQSLSGATTHEHQDWIHAVNDAPEPALPDLSKLQLEDDPSYDWGYRPPRRVSPRDVVPDGDVEAALSAAARASLHSEDIAGDVFAFGITVVEIFTCVESCSSPSAIRLLRMALKSLRPPHPGRVPELHGLDDALWNICLRCWRIPDYSAVSMVQLVAAMEIPRDDIIICPVNWPREELESWTRTHIRKFDSFSKVEKVGPARDLDEGVESLRVYVKIGGQDVPAKAMGHGLLRRLRAKFWVDLYGEIIVWYQLRHPNVYPLLGICEIHDVPTFVVPWVDVGTCNDFLRQNPDADRLSIMVQVAAGLSYLHTRTPAIVHGDVRAHSVVLSSKGTAQISNFDFGPEQDPTQSFDKSLSYNEGPLRNSAPDYLNSRGAHRTTWSDVYSFGMFIFELHSENPPFHDAIEYIDLYETVKAGTLPGRPTHPQLDDELWAIVLLCWRRRPMSRPTMPEVHRRLTDLISRRNNVHPVHVPTSPSDKDVSSS